MKREKVRQGPDLSGGWNLSGSGEFRPAHIFINHQTLTLRCVISTTHNRDSHTLKHHVSCRRKQKKEIYVQMSKSKDFPSTVNCHRQLIRVVPEKVSFSLPPRSAEPPSSLAVCLRTHAHSFRLAALSGGCLSDPAHFEMSQVFLLITHAYSAALGNAL